MRAIDGIAFDGGSGIRTVEVSADGGITWAAATHRHLAEVFIQPVLV
jgi:hypothetical protein